MEPGKHLAQLVNSSCLIQRSTCLCAVVTMQYNLFAFTCVCVPSQSADLCTGGAVYTGPLCLLLCVHRHGHKHLVQGYAVGRRHTPNRSNAAGWERWSGHLGNGQYLASLGQLWIKRKKDQALNTKGGCMMKRNGGWGGGGGNSSQQPQAKWT